MHVLMLILINNSNIGMHIMCNVMKSDAEYLYF